MFWWDELTDNRLIPSKHSLENSGLHRGQSSRLISSEPSSSTVVLIRFDPRGTWLWMKFIGSGLRKCQSFANNPWGWFPQRPPLFGAAGEESSPKRAPKRSSGLSSGQSLQIQSSGPNLREIVNDVDDLPQIQPWKKEIHRFLPQKRPELRLQSPGPAFPNAALTPGGRRGIWPWDTYQTNLRPQ